MDKVIRSQAWGGPQTLTFRQFRYFIAVAEAESVSRAAQEIGISQSAITAAVQALELEIGATLFVRHQKGVRLTHEGHQLLRHARSIMAAVADARRAVSVRPEEVSGELNLGVTRMVSGYYLADLLARFSRVFRQVRVRVVEEERSYLEHLLVNGELDVGLLLVSNLGDRQALETELLVRSPWRVWLPARHRLLDSSVLTLAEVAAEGVIMLTMDELAETTSRYWAEAGLRPRIVLKTSSVEAVRSLVGTGVGIATLPDMAYRPWSLEGDRLEARHLSDPVPSVDVGLVWRRGAPLSTTAWHFIEMCREYSPRQSTQRL
ncbi:transcriptional regulator, LysR family [Faunimonas pinastri]|uniref:Transcriptional regulator, LysR family n=1 Tax=Faunimonas pinastri TaxID=1855383 RepID=A0A1H9KAK5_9HYPH|nr:LysR family transcriptional regulator [Faunimonas pinastri]SEQ96246.1 transcriptional regulator, LysR family [Faunimonas pinastri]